MPDQQPALRFLADESCDFAVVRALRASGYDVRAVAEVAMGASDEVVLEAAAREGRILLTEDKDFGQLVFAGSASTGGVIFVRFPAAARDSLPQTILDLVHQQGGRLTGTFVVVEPGRVRISHRID